MYDLCVCFVASLNCPGRKTAKKLIFRLNPNVLFQACVSSSHWKETLHSAVQTIMLRVEAIHMSAGILVSGDSFLCRTLHNLSVVLCLLQ